jgi:hypothetical protein
LHNPACFILRPDCWADGCRVDLSLTDRGAEHAGRYKKGTVPFADVVHPMDIAAMVGVGLIVADPVESGQKSKRPN